MEVENVIKIRTALKGDHNIPLRVYADNAFCAADESNIASFTKWDDANGLLWIFRLPNPQRDKLPSNIENCVSVYCLEYASIQGLEAAFVPLESSKDKEKEYGALDDVFKTMGTAGATMSDDFKNAIKAGFANMLGLGHKYSEITPTHDALIFGPDAADTDDDWLYNKFTESTKETLRYKERNEKAIEDAKNKEE